MRHHPLLLSDRLWLRLTGILVIVVSLVAVLGWILDVDTFAKWGPSDSRMGLNVAVAMLIAGGGFVALAQRQRWVLGIGGAVLIVFVGLTLAGYATVKLLGVFGVFQRHSGSATLGHPGHMAPNTAAALALVGAAQVLLAAHRASRGIVATLAGVVGALALLPLLQYGAWFATTVGQGTYHGMALPIAFCLILLATGLLKLEHTPSEGGLPFMAAALGMLFSIGVIAVQANRELLDANRLVTHTYQVRGAVDRFVEEVARAESSSRAYALTGEQLFRDRVPIHEQEALQFAKTLRELALDNPPQLARIQGLQALAEEKFAQNEALLQLRQSAGPAGAGEYLRGLLSERGQPTSNLVLLAEAVRVEENRLLELRRATQVSVERNTRLVQIAGSVIAVALLLCAVVLTRRAAADRRAAEAQFRGSFEDAGIGMALVALDGRMFRGNRTLIELLGYPEVELTKLTFQEITHPDDLAADLKNVRDLLEGRARTYQMEKRYRHKDGHIVWVNLTVSLVRNAAGAPAHFISQIEDISARKRLEEELLAARDTALAAVRTKSDFLAAMSHEIRTPMNGIIGMATLLLDVPMPDEQREMVQVINQSADSLLGLINDILDISKMEAGKFSIDPEDFHFGDMLKATIAMLAPKAAQKKLSLSSQMDPRLTTPLFGDSRRIRQILTNLIGNAVKFTDRGEVTVQAQVTESTPQGVKLKVTVRDTGMGISADAQKRLFQPFVQVDASTERRFGGTGLGLAICRQLVDLMGGQVGVDSEPGRGSEFWFTLALPWARILQPDTESSRRNFRVLVVDDSDIDRDLTVRVLAAMGLDAGSAASGEKGLLELRSARGSPHPWDMVLVDHRMPGMSGLDFGRALRDDPALRAIPVVLVSGGALQDASESSLIGFEAFISKPVRADQLARILQRFVSVLPEPAGETPAWEGNKNEPGANGACRILVVDDNGANRAVARMTLAKMGFEVDLAESGDQALQKLAAGHFDAVLMDCQMPGLDGYETTRRIRSGVVAGIDPRIPVIAHTAFAMPGDREKCREAGMDDYLAKPLRATELQDMLHRHGIKVPARAASASAPITPSIIDAGYIAELRSLAGQNGPSLWPELVTPFLESGSDRLREMENFLWDRRKTALGEAAHHFAGSCAAVGSVEGKRVALEVEKLSGGEDWTELTIRVAALRAAYERYVAVVSASFPAL